MIVFLWGDLWPLCSEKPTCPLNTGFCVRHRWRNQSIANFRSFEKKKQQCILFESRKFLNFEIDFKAILLHIKITKLLFYKLDLGQTLQVVNNDCYIRVSDYLIRLSLLFLSNNVHFLFYQYLALNLLILHVRYLCNCTWIVCCLAY